MARSGAAPGRTEAAAPPPGILSEGGVALPVG
jgi:hypothetical protein